MDYAAIKTLAAGLNTSAAVLSPETAALLLCASGEYQEKINQWSGSGDSGGLSPEEKDDAEGMIARALGEVMENSLVGVFVSGIVQPRGTLLCDGSIVSRADYPALYEKWAGTARAIGPDAIQLPDLRGLVLMGASAEYPVESAGGEEAHALTVDEIPAHNHTYTAPMVSDLDFEDIGIPQPAVGINPIPQSTGGSGGGQAHNNLQPFFAVNWYVFYA